MMNMKTTITLMETLVIHQKMMMMRKIITMVFTTNKNINKLIATLNKKDKGNPLDEYDLEEDEDNAADMYKGIFLFLKKYI